MNTIFWEAKEIIIDIGCGFCKILKTVVEGLVDFICIIFGIVRYILFNIMRIVLAITSIFFLAGLFMFYQNIKEALSGVWFIETTRFIPMLLLCGSYIAAFLICKLLRPRD